MSRFVIQTTPLAGLQVIERQQNGDSRGFLSRLFCADELAAAGWTKPVAQINHTLTQQRGTVRGMHFQQTPHVEMKLVNCIRGAVLDVAVDVRAGSPTFLQWHAEELSANNRRALLIPEGFAHGFQTLEDNCELLYLHSIAHMAEAESALDALDPRLSICWPLPVTKRSVRDTQHSLINHRFTGVFL